mgnify:FL=1
MATVPIGATLLNLSVINKSAFGTAGATITLNVGDSTDVDIFGTLANCSSTSIHSWGGLTGVCAQSLADQTAERNVIIQTVAASGTVSGGQGGAAGAGAKIATVTWRKP